MRGRPDLLERPNKELLCDGADARKQICAKGSGSTGERKVTLWKGWAHRMGEGGVRERERRVQYGPEG